MQKAIYIAPKDYKNIGGLKYPIENYVQALSSKYELTVLEIGYRYSDEDKQRLRRVMAGVRYHILLVYGLNQCSNCIMYLKNTECWKQIKKFAHLQDSEFFYAKSIYEKMDWHVPKDKLLYYLKTHVYKHREKRCLDAYDRALYVSNVDADYARATYKNFKAKIHVVENGIDVPDRNILITADKYEDHTLRLGFLSHMSSSIINENVKPLLQDILPELQRRKIAIEFIIAGKGMEEELKALCAPYHNVSYKGYVQELVDFYKSVDIILSYTKKKNGMLNKILEAWAYEKCVVGYDYNFRAFSKATHGKHYLSGKSAYEIVNQIEVLRNKPEQIIQIGLNARELIEKEYTWNNQRRLYLELLD